MRKKCNWCQKVKKVKYRDSVNRTFYCCLECMMNAIHINYLSRIICARCNTPIRLNAIVIRRYNGKADEFYCCEKCMMDDLGIFKECEDE